MRKKTYLGLILDTCEDAITHFPTPGPFWVSYRLIAVVAPLGTDEPAGVAGLAGVTAWLGVDGVTWLMEWWPKVKPATAAMATMTTTQPVTTAAKIPACCLGVVVGE